ncbi:alpha/beta hydrolase fold domain-containing protein [Periweissella fabalis]|uniref:Alpha/beta hydrolase n=1 Tax=Periweissella fabalis TaxID=1070421 RepID=A0A7X6N3J0_9LACO|nr:alpha/beta hydrolase [Periweissella fabalis]MCM0599843.1 alpha/beta hydrolase [Periweissella fabalis]NKZ24102.1 alpha/beta hydrolase [Periweissella fabalis]
MKYKFGAFLLATLGAGYAYTKYQAHKEHQSQSSWLISDAIKVLKPFPPIKSVADYQKLYQASEQPYVVPKNVQLQFGFKARPDNADIIELNEFNEDNQRIIFYVHGGAYWMQPIYFHYAMLHHLAKKLNARIVMPIYPKAPAHHAPEVHAMILDTYQQLLAEEGVKPENITFMGDSAGGGFQLAFMQKLRDLDVKLLPSRAILLSPWLDVTMTNPAIDAIQPLDQMLNTGQVRFQGEKYAGPLAPSDPLVSPIYGDSSNLPPIDVFTGTHDILFADAKRFKALALEHDWDVNTHIYPKMLHVFSSLPIIPEAKESLAEIVNIIKAND